MCDGENVEESSQPSPVGDNVSTEGGMKSKQRRIRKMSATERRELARKPLPPIGLVRVYGGRSHGGVEVQPLEDRWSTRRGERKPTMGQVEGE